MLKSIILLFIIVFLFTVTLLLVIYLIRKTFLRLRKLDKDELIKERDKSLNKSSGTKRMYSSNNRGWFC